MAPTTKRRVIVEIDGHQHPVDYDVADSTETRARDIAVRDFVAEKIAHFTFEPVKGERDYEGWSRCAINISGPVCISDEAELGAWQGLRCMEEVDEKETQLCYDCSGGDEDEEEETS